jgi:hypothetical protein
LTIKIKARTVWLETGGALLLLGTSTCSSSNLDTARDLTGSEAGAGLDNTAGGASGTGEPAGELALARQMALMRSRVEP